MRRKIQATGYQGKGLKGFAQTLIVTKQPPWQLFILVSPYHPVQTLSLILKQLDADD